MRLSLIFCILICSFSCQEEKVVEAANKTAIPTINPNGDSELALLMREMFDHGMKMKKALESGEALVVNRDFSEILTAQATEPEKAASAEFQAFGRTYVDIMRKMENASSTEMPELYEAMVADCMACHTALCPGPKMRIKHLLIK